LEIEPPDRQGAEMCDRGAFVHHDLLCPNLTDQATLRRTNLEDRSALDMFFSPTL